MSESHTPTRTRLREIHHEIDTLRDQGARVLYRLGVLLREVEEGELWRESGQVNFSAWLENEVDIGRSTAYRAIAVATHFNEDIAARYGVDKLYQGLRYLELTRRVEKPGDLISLDLRLRDARGRFIAVPFHTASVRQVQDAIALLGERSSRPVKLEEELDARLGRLESGLPAPAAGLRPAKQRVEVVRTREGRVSLSFRQIPLDELAAFVEAIRRELLEA